MENKENEEYRRMYPDLPDLTENASKSDASSGEEVGEEITCRRSVPLTQSPIRSYNSHSSKRKSNSNDIQQNDTISKFVLIVICLLAPFVGFLIYGSYTGGKVSIKEKKEWKNIVTKLQPYLMDKRDKFLSQKEDIWYQIITGLKGLSNDPKSPAVYLLTYDENSMHSSSCIIEIITTAANNFLLDKNGWSFLNGSLLTKSQINDPGILIEKIANTVETSKIIVVTDVQHIPAKLAQGFHFLIDEYNPKIREAVYVLTLKISSHLKSSRPVEAAENALRESWKDIKIDLLQPLITRVTNQVLAVTAENSDISCPLITSVTTEIYI